MFTLNTYKDGALNMCQELLEKIAQERAAYSESMQPPCPPRQIENLSKKALKNLNCNLPDGYIRFLEKTNGLDWNGITIYACETTLLVGYKDRYIEGIIEANQAFRESDTCRGLIFLGESGMDAYVYRPDTDQYQIAERISLRSLEDFSSFELMFRKAIENLI